jgi:O-antigen/teichoic acid export membrane protein
MALLRRAIRQKTISQIHLLAFAWGSGIAILAAWLGLGWWALVLQQLLAYIAVFSAAWWCSAYRPGPPGSLRAVLPLIKFGGCSSLSNVFNYLQANVSTIAVGYFAGVTELGYFSRALLLRNLPTQYGTSSFNDVMIPSLVALRNDPERMGGAYRKSLAAIAFVSCPLAAWLGVAAPEIIPLLYGPGWANAAPLLSWLAVAGVMLPLQATAVWLYLASGKSRQLLGQSIAMTPVITTAILLGACWGTAGIAAAGALTFAGPITATTLFLAHRAASIRFDKTIRTISPILAACSLAALAGWGTAVLAQRADCSWEIILLSKTISGATTYLMSVYLLNGAFPVDLRMSRLLARERHVTP